MNNLTHLSLESASIIDRARNKVNTLDLFLTSNTNIFSKATADSPLGHSDHCFITLQHNRLVSFQDKSFSAQKVLHFSNADWDSLRCFYSAYPWYSGCSYDPSSFATYITTGILLGMDLFIPSSYKSGKKNFQNGLIHLSQFVSTFVTLLFRL